MTAFYRQQMGFLHDFIIDHDATGNINVRFCFDYVVLKQCKVKIIIPGV